MKRTAVWLLVLLALAGLPLTSAGSSGASRAPAPGLAGEMQAINDVAAGKVAPLTLKFKNLDSTYFRFLSYSYQRGGGGWLGTLSSYGGGGLPYYSQGRSVKIGDDSYLIAYTVEMKGSDYSLRMYGRPSANAPEPEKITGDTELGLYLLNLRNQPSLSGLRTFNLKAELALFDEYLQDYKEMMAARAQMEQPMGEQQDNLKKLAMSLQMYSIDYDVMPPMDQPDAFRKALDEYVESKDIFLDPETGEPYALNTTLSGKKLADISDAKSMVAIYQAKAGKDGLRGAAFVDGSTKRVSEAEWGELKKKSGIE
jgi:hypothetical protein